MTSEPQRCGYMVREYAIVAPTLPDAVLHRDVPCNLPIEGYGPCAYEAGPYRCEVEAEHHLQGVNHITHAYQPSQWRHFPVYGIVPHGGVDHGHEATPND